MPHYIPGTIKENSPIAIVGEAPGNIEEMYGAPFLGDSGDELTRMLAQASIPRTLCTLTNVCRYRPADNDITRFIEYRKGVAQKRGLPFFRGRWIEPFVEKHIADLETEIKLVQPNVILALGETALWALTGETGIGKWRGSVMETAYIKRNDGRPFKVIPAYHPAGVLRQWSWRYITVHDFGRMNKESEFPEVRIPPYSFLINPSYEAAVAALEARIADLDAGRNTRLAFDIETRQQQIACFGVAWSKLDAFCIPLLSHAKGGSFWTLEEEVALVRLFQRLLTHPNLKGIGQNFLYDEQYIARYFGVYTNIDRDTMLSQHVLFPGLEKGLDFLSSMYCGFHRYWKDEGKEWRKNQDELQLWSYNCKDAVVTWEVDEAIGPAIVAAGLQEQERFQQNLRKAVLDIMLRGMRIDPERKKVYRKELEEAITERKAAIDHMAGHALNPKSSKQMHAFFYEDLHIVPVLHRKTRKPTLSDDALTKIGKKLPELERLTSTIQEYRSLSVFKANFVEAKAMGERMYTSLNPAGTETFRFSSSKDAFGSGGNLENIPKGTDAIIATHLKGLPNRTAHIRDLVGHFGSEEGTAWTEARIWDQVEKEAESGYITLAGDTVTYRYTLPNLRKIFIPDEDCVFMDWDLDRADLQVVVWEADDTELKQALREGLDIHKHNAKLLGISRQQAKIWVHLTNYDGKARTAAIACGMTVHQSEKARVRWFAAHPGIQKWHERTQDSLIATRSVRNAFGYRRFYFDRLEGLLSQALAWVPQSTVALIINTALLRIHNELPDTVPLLMQVHDSLAMQGLRRAFPGVWEEIRSRMLVTVPYPDPLVVPSSGQYSLTSWGDLTRSQNGPIFET